MKRIRPIPLILALLLALSARAAGSAAADTADHTEHLGTAPLSQTAAPMFPDAEEGAAMDKITLSFRRPWALEQLRR